MKNKISSACLFVLLVAGFVSCKQAVAPQEVNGCVYDASMNNITVITTAGDTLNISTTDADPAKVSGVLLNDSVAVTYQKENRDGTEVLKAVALTVIVHSPCFYIQGSWVQPNPINAEEVQGFTLNQDGTASSINMATLVMKSWEMADKTLILGSESIGNKERFEGKDTLNIIKLDADSLVLSSNATVVWRLGREKQE